jgi:hypothetical protein
MEAPARWLRGHGRNVSPKVRIVALENPYRAARRRALHHMGKPSTAMTSSRSRGVLSRSVNDVAALASAVTHRTAGIVAECIREKVPSTR